MASIIKPAIITYTILEDGKAIQCNACGYISHNENDIKFKYCGACHDFHDAPRGKIRRIFKIKKSEQITPTI